MNFPGQGWIPNPCRDSQSLWMWHLWILQSWGRKVRDLCSKAWRARSFSRKRDGIREGAGAAGMRRELGKLIPGKKRDQEGDFPAPEFPSSQGRRDKEEREYWERFPPGKGCQELGMVGSQPCRDSRSLWILGVVGILTPRHGGAGMFPGKGLEQQEWLREDGKGLIPGKKRDQEGAFPASPIPREEGAGGEGILGTIPTWKGLSGTGNGGIPHPCRDSQLRILQSWGRKVRDLCSKAWRARSFSREGVGAAGMAEGDGKGLIPGKRGIRREIFQLQNSPVPREEGIRRRGNIGSNSRLERAVRHWECWDSSSLQGFPIPVDVALVDPAILGGKVWDLCSKTWRARSFSREGAGAAGMAEGAGKGLIPGKKRDQEGDFPAPEFPNSQGRRARRRGNIGKNSHMERVSRPSLEVVESDGILGMIPTWKGFPGLGNAGWDIGKIPGPGSGGFSWDIGNDSHMEGVSRPWNWWIQLGYWE
ncbi:uncharacterized protein LOC126651550 isoform X2 [Myiozetetes cayanensis]|uniref:uncharacterized protein LOC126651550 isoform X2 n=1 Tax=Myiozetetes cayanensis TaxID=478635 RepID=UPI002160C51D|nr:uncharacterized protein LOC126651550 isoform X2 [Myiozetetes cayanensis]